MILLRKFVVALRSNDFCDNFSYFNMSVQFNPGYRYFLINDDDNDDTPRIGKIYVPEHGSVVFKNDAWVLSLSAQYGITKRVSNKNLFYSRTNAPPYHERISKIYIKLIQDLNKKFKSSQLDDSLKSGPLYDDLEHVQHVADSEPPQLDENLEFNVQVSKLNVTCGLLCGGSLNLKKASHRKTYGEILENLKGKSLL